MGLGRRGPVLGGGGVVLRPLRRSDEREWLRLRRHNRTWLRPWEATSPPGRPDPTISFGSFVRSERRSWRTRRAFPMAIEVEGKLVGRVTVSGIEWGAECGGSIGYWVAKSHAGRGVAPTAVALLAKYAFDRGIHRLEIAVRPENRPSVRVAQKLGFREEGKRTLYLYIDGAWRDHIVYALTAEEPRTGRFWELGS